MDIHAAQEQEHDDGAMDHDAHLVAQLRLVFKRCTILAHMAETSRTGILEIASAIEIPIEAVQRDADLQALVANTIRRSAENLKENKQLKGTVETLRKRVVHLSDSNKRIGDELELRMAELDSAQTEELYFLKSRRNDMVRGIWSLYQTIRTTQYTANECTKKSRDDETFEEEMMNVTLAISGLQNKAHFIISNFFTEPEKMDLGTGDVAFRASTEESPRRSSPRMTVSLSESADVEEEIVRVKKEKKKKRSAAENS